MRLQITMMFRPTAFLCITFLTVAGCASIGPATVRQDQVDYADAVSEAAKRQLLLNLVKLRYGDTPNFVSLSQLVAGYTLEGRLLIGGDFDRQLLEFGHNFDLGLGGTFSDRPTATYTPLQGSAFAELMLKPISPNSLFAVILAGGSPQIVFGLAVDTINGLNNWSRRPGGYLPERREFNRVVRLLSELNDVGRLQLRFESTPAGVQAYLDTRRRDGQLVDPRYAQLIELLGLDPSLGRYRIVFGLGDSGPDQITIQTRSLIGTLREIASRISVPEADIEDGRTYAPPPGVQGAGKIELGIRHEKLPPFDAFVAVRYDDDWFWISNDDFNAKATYTMLLLLFNLAIPGNESGLPVITIPTG
jgi:hypothetical protein